MATALENLDSNLREFLELLNSAGVKYLLVGGYAVNFHGHHRATDDLDVWIAVDEVNAKRVSAVIQSFAGFPARQVPPSLFLKKHRAIIFGREPLRIDVLTGPDGVEFDSCFDRRVVTKVDGTEIPVISLEDLKLNKRASGRTKDLADLENLPAKPLPAAKSIRKKRKPRGR